MPLKGNINIQIQLKIDYPNNELPSFILTNTINHLEDALRSSEFGEILDLSNACLFERPLEFGELPRWFYSALMREHDLSPGWLLTLTNIKKGSYVFSGIVMGISLYILKNTFGETLKQAWLESKAHEKVKDFLLTVLGKRAKNIVEEFEYGMNNDNDYSEKIGTKPEIKTKIDDSEKGMVIKIYVSFEPDEKEFSDREKMIEDFTSYVKEKDD